MKKLRKCSRCRWPAAPWWLQVCSKPPWTPLFLYKLQLISKLPNSWCLNGWQLVVKVDRWNGGGKCMVVVFGVCGRYFVKGSKWDGWWKVVKMEEQKRQTYWASGRMVSASGRLVRLCVFQQALPRENGVYLPRVSLIVSNWMRAGSGWSPQPPRVP